jgi:hypothetical protein
VDKEDRPLLAAYAARAEYPRGATPSELRAAATVDRKNETISITNFTDRLLEHVNVWINSLVRRTFLLVGRTFLSAVAEGVVDVPIHPSSAAPGRRRATPAPFQNPQLPPPHRPITNTSARHAAPARAGPASANRTSEQEIP